MTLGKYIWGPTKPKVARALLSKKKHAGGQGLPDIRDYFRAIALSFARKWWTPDDTKAWIQIESSTIKHASLKDYLIHLLWDPSQPNSDLLTIKHVCNLWSTIHNAQKDAKSTLLTHATIRTLELTIPDNNLTNWQEKGLLLYLKSCQMAVSSPLILSTAYSHCRIQNSTTFLGSGTLLQRLRKTHPQ